MTRTLGLDFDDVVTDTLAYKQVYFERFGTGLGESEIKLLKANLYNDLEASLELLQFKPGAVEGITKLQNHGLDLQIITARGADESRIAKALLERSNLNLPIHSVGYGNSKLPYINECAIFIDDDPRNLIPSIGTKTRLFLMSTAENLDFIHEGITRVTDWEEFINLICKES